MENFSEKVLKIIKGENIKPEPRWKFISKDYFIWFFIGASTIVGSLAFSVVIFMFRNNDWSFYRYLDNGFWGDIILSMPYFWFLFLIIFIFLSFYNFKHSKKGYRYGWHSVLVISILISIIFGSVFYYLGLGERIDNLFSKNMPYYNRMVRHKIDMWTQPERGILSGEIIDVEKNNLILRDYHGEFWKIDLLAVKDDSYIKKGGEVRIIGKIIKDNEFLAREILPFHVFSPRLFNNCGRGCSR